MLASCAEDFRAIARRRLPRFLFDYIDGGAGDETTLRENGAAWRAIRLRQQVLRDVSDVALNTTLFGQRLATPAVLAPVGLTGMYARRGEVQAARASAASGIPFCLSTVSVCAVEEVAAAAPVPPWFQLYVIRDRAFMRDLLARARAAGVSTLVFTVDMPVPGARRRDVHSAMSGPRAGLRRALQIMGRPRWAWDVGVRGRPHILGNVAPVLERGSGLQDFMGWLGANFDPAIQWRDLEWLRAEWTGTLIIKGVLDAEDARMAIRLGADGIVVSNHGGRQLDGAMASAAALPRIAEAVAGDATVLVDSGIRSGTDILRALALGADGVMLGRAWVYALAAGGERGVRELLRLLEAEMRVGMALTGVDRISAIDARILSA